MGFEYTDCINICLLEREQKEFARQGSMFRGKILPLLLNWKSPTPEDSGLKYTFLCVKLIVEVEMAKLW